MLIAYENSSGYSNLSDESGGCRCLDGSYYYYRGINETLVAAMPSGTTAQADGHPYQYVGYYEGSSTTSTSTSAQATVGNGSLSRQLNTNLTLTTHVPRLRLIASLRLESTLLNYRRNLSTRQLHYSDDGYALIIYLDSNNSTDDFHRRSPQALRK